MNDIYIVYTTYTVVDTIYIFGEMECGIYDLKLIKLQVIPLHTGSRYTIVLPFTKN